MVAAPGVFVIVVVPVDLPTSTSSVFAMLGCSNWYGTC